MEDVADPEIEDEIMSTPGRWTRIKEIVGAALECEPFERGAFLDQACSQDRELRAEIESLLAAYADAEELSENPWAATTVADPTGEQKTIGPYRLIQILGVGGMGQVWLAEQTEPVRRRLALKLIRAGMFDTTLLRRFQSERQSLAIMEHPTIAKVFDAGTTPDGQPYLAMEYVDGSPITDYCDRKKMGIRERLNLFHQVCEGVQHAHQKAIIHRDLKPSNILVTEVDGKPMPRIIDFGLAKATVPHAIGETLFTHVGGFLGTPGYMSPEQADPDVHDIDTRTDVYSLGVVLYELLTGFLPFDTTNWKTQRLDEVLKQLRETDPQRPSAKVSANSNISTARAQARGTEPHQLATALRGDLDWITLKALGKDRERRYGASSELAADVERYLANRPIVARPDSSGYRLRKYIRRNRVAVALVSSAVALMIAFAVTQAVQLRRITRERDRADRITEFMTNMFKVSDPSEARGNSITAREVLDKSAKEIESGLSQDVEVQSELMQVMALTYTNLGLYSRAHELAEHALEERRRALGANHRKTLESMTQLGWVMDLEGRETEAEKSIRGAIDLQSRVLGPEDSLTLESKDDLAIILERQGHFVEEENLERRLLAIRARTLGPEHPQTLRSRLSLADALQGQKRFAEAEREFRQLLDIERRVWGDTHPYTMATMHNLANMLQEQSRYAEAEALYRETLETSQRVLGPEHPQTANTMTTLANAIATEQGRNVEAEALYRKSLDIELRVLGPEHSYTAQAREGLANVLSSEGRYVEAEKIHRQNLAMRMRVLGPDDTDTLLTQYNLGDVLFRQNRFAEAESIFRGTLESQARVLGPENSDTLASKAFLARILIKVGNSREAENLARQAFDVQLRILGPQHSDTINTMQYLGAALVYNGHYDEAKALYESALEAIAKTPDANMSSVWYDFACIDIAAGHLNEAVDHLRHAIESGFTDVEHMRTDSDLKPLHKDPRFNALLAQARSRPTAAAQKTY